MIFHIIAKVKIKIMLKYCKHYQIYKAKITLVINFIQKLKVWIKSKVLKLRPEIKGLIKKDK